MSSPSSPKPKSAALPNLIELGPSALREACEKRGIERWRSAQILDWIYRKGVYRFDQMTNLPQSLREAIGAQFAIRTGKPRTRSVSKEDGSTKVVLELEGGDLVETVYIPKGARRTICVSSQVGCKFRCAFCASGQAGFFRNLSAGEILAQVLFARDSASDRRITNVVFMGIGEPLDNYDNVLAAVRLLNDPALLGLGARRITISTCGVVPKILKLAEEGLQIELSVSLHGARDDVRQELMPVNRRWPLAELLPACDAYVAKTKREITFEYILAERLNAAPSDAEELAFLLKDRRCTVNLIPLNPVAEFPYKRPARPAIDRFAAILRRHGIRTTVRFSSGTDINAACGQLRSAEMKKGEK